MRRIKVLSVFGTRPEAIKMCPLVKVLKADARVQSAVCATGQHREMLRQAMDLFDVKADYDLDIMRVGQTLEDVTARVLLGVSDVLKEARPDIVLVHGDTTTSFAAALAAFYAHVPVGHVEAGLRTDTIASPFPEELNRRLTGRIAEMHFAPTARNAQNLARESTTKGVFVTGNTAIDALRYTVADPYAFHSKALEGLDVSGRVLLVTAHRRENWGRGLESICEAVQTVVDRFKDLTAILPVHPNPAVAQTVRGMLSSHPRIRLTEPLDVTDMHNLIARSYLVLTDSGGLQEEAPALGAPVVVLRSETERPEAVESGTAVLAGTDRDEIIRIASGLLTDRTAYERMKKAVSPYGDGHASEKILSHLLSYFGVQ